MKTEDQLHIETDIQAELLGRAVHSLILDACHVERLAERERCARLVENWDSIAQVNDNEEIAAAIRSGK